MIYDGDCRFCTLWIQRWKSLTRDKVKYIPYKNAGSEFHPLTSEDFEKSVHYITTKKEVFSGAGAVFKSLADASVYQFLFWLYNRMSIFKNCTEIGYRFIANNRRISSFMTYIFWGKNLEKPTYHLSRWIFLKLIAIVYFIAFLSFWIQADGLVGQNGILPANDFFQSVAHQLGSSAFFNVPSLQLFLPGYSGLGLICGLGLVFSLTLFIGMMPRIFLIFLWLLYLSVVAAGQRFLSFQWDILLLECGFLSIFFSPGVWFYHFKTPVPISGGMLFLLRWLLFRLMFFSGVTKLASGDSTWWDLTALSYHYETQPLATWTAWYAHQLPMWVQRISTGAMFGIELVAPFFIFGPRRLRYAAFGSISLFMVLIACTGNYTYFNLLTLVLCVVLLDDKIIKKIIPFQWRNKHNSLVVHSKNSYVKKSSIFILVCLVVILSASNTAMRYYPNFSPYASIQKLLNTIRPFHIINNYGLFSVMTVRRPELIIETSDDGNEWKEIEFKWKAGALEKRPQFVQPHQPRLDWQMWFAALFYERVSEYFKKNYGRDPVSPEEHFSLMRQVPISKRYRWFYLFLNRIFEGEKEVLSLLKNGKIGPAPKYLRVWLYDYHFTSFTERSESGNWWKRNNHRLILPKFSKEEIWIP